MPAPRYTTPVNRIDYAAVRAAMVAAVSREPWRCAGETYDAILLLARREQQSRLSSSEGAR
jgi:hypothetical protein